MENLQYKSRDNINKPTSSENVHNCRTLMLAKLHIPSPIDNKCSWKYFITGHVSESVCHIVSKKPQLLFYLKEIFQD